MASPLITELLRRLSRPSGSIWLDGRAVTSSTEVSQVNFTIDSGDNPIVAPSNPDRVAIGFLVSTTTPQAIWFSPFPDVRIYQFGTNTGTPVSWFKLADYPGILGNSWYAYSDGLSTFKVIDVTRNRS